MLPRLFKFYSPNVLALIDWPGFFSLYVIRLPSGSGTLGCVNTNTWIWQLWGLVTEHGGYESRNLYGPRIFPEAVEGRGRKARDRPR